MTLLEALGQYFESLGFGTPEVDLFFNTQPDDPGNCITIIDTGGYPGDNTGAIRNPTYQILIRNDSYVIAKEKSEQTYDTLHLNENFEIGEYYIYVAEFEDEPAYIGDDNKGRAEITMNLRLERRS